MTRKITLYGLLTALTVAVSILVIIPIPGTNGFVTLCDAGIYIAGFLLGPIGGLAVGGLSGGFIDLLSGYPQWIIFSILIHGSQGWLVGYFYQKKPFQQYIGLILGCLVMTGGYALATSLLFGSAAALTSIPSNLIQSGFGALAAIPISQAIKHALPAIYAKKEGLPK